MIVFDIISHGLWGGAIFGWKKYFWWAFFFGIMPDLLSFGLIILTRLFKGTMSYGAPELSSIPPWIYTMYSLTHSLLIASIVVFILFKISPPIGFASLAWILHILMDIPAHSQEYFPTPFLYPLSNFTFNGISSIYLWGINWLALIFYYLYLFFFRK